MVAVYVFNVNVFVVIVIRVYMYVCSWSIDEYYRQEPAIRLRDKSELFKIASRPNKVEQWLHGKMTNFTFKSLIIVCDLLMLSPK